MENLVENHTYLIKYRFEDSLYSITVLVITDKAYHIRWNNGMNTSQTWEEKEVFHSKCRIVEDISDFTKIRDMYNRNITFENVLEIKTEWETCPICKGFGTIPDVNSTAGNKTCPLCNGSKQIPKITQIEKK